MRASRIDDRVQPVVNLATNPSFERGDVGSTVVRQNKAPYPQANALWVGQWGANGAGTDSFENGMRKSTWTTSATGGNARMYLGPEVAVTPGEVMTMSLDVAAFGGGVTLLIDWLQANGTWVSLNTSALVTPPASTLTPSRLSVTAMVPLNQNVSRARLYLRWNGIASAVVGNWLAAGRLLFETRSGALPYFDGSTIDNSGITYSWDGVAGASSSTAKASIRTVRRNFCFRPLGPTAPSGVTTGYSGVNGATIAWDATGIAVDCTSGTVTDAGLALAASLADPGTGSVTISLDVYGITAGQWKLSAQGPWVNNTNVSSSYVSIAAGETKRLTYTFNVLVAGATRALYLLRGPAAGGTEKARVSKILFEATSLNLPFFDGTYSPDPDLTPFWQNTDNSTTSILGGVQFPNTAVYGGAVIRTWLVGSKGLSCARYISNTPLASSEAMFFGFSGFGSMPLKPGKTYTALVRLKLLAPLSSIGTNSLRIGIRYSGTINGIIFSSQAENIAGEQILRVVGTIPDNSGINSTMIQLNTYTPGGGPDTYWDELMIVEGVYNGPYLDGDMPNCVWRGTPHASPSVGYPSLV